MTRTLPRWAPGLPLPLRPWRVTTTTGHRDDQHEVMASTAAQAIRAALELAPPGSRLRSCLTVGEW